MTTTTNGATIAPNNLVTVPKPDIRRANFTLVGTSPLICHAWSEKAKRQILDKHMKKADPGKEAKVPEDEFRGSLYPMPDGSGFDYGFPAVAFKAAMVRAGTYVDLKMTFLRGAFHVAGELIGIDADAPTMREDMVRVGMTVDYRFRGQFMPWSVTLPIDFNARNISLEQLANLLMIAGFSVGVGEWRPERDGSYGQFSLA
jgi:hypothetical protein